MAALWLRAIFHDAGTFDASDSSGGLDVSLITPNETNNLEANGGLADMLALGGIVTVATCGGPQVPFKTGRASITVPNDVAGKLPHDAFSPLSTIKAGFLRMGLTDVDMLVSTTGSHSLGGAHTAISPNITKEEFTPFDSTTGVFDNDIFKKVLTGNCVIPIDCLFAKDPELLPLIQQLSTFCIDLFDLVLNIDPVSIFIKQHSDLTKIAPTTTGGVVQTSKSSSAESLVDGVFVGLFIALWLF
ncbi:UNVERIFIED_CONTAM: hypothetical protein HDU68_008095 [Siphonaria sp. JEL0065]|nr:hypothetical protein HDU68_008095 [Siphonaria sp. JEL0065]